MNQQHSKTRVALLSVTSNTTLVLMKLIVGLIVGSVSVISEAIHSGVDLIAAVMALYSVRTSSRPADEEHPFGHGKIENVSGTVEALLIFIAAGWIIYESVNKFLHPEPMEMAFLGVGVMLISAVTNTVVSQMLLKVGKETDSIALQADAWHLRTDIYTSIVVMVGCGIILLGQYFFPGYNLNWIDSVCAMAVAFLIIKAAYDLTKLSARLRKLWKILSRAVSSGYSYCGRSLSVLIMLWRNAVLLASLLLRRINKTIYDWLRKLWKTLSGAVSSGYPYYRHSLPVRIMHWGNVVFLATLLMSGLNIFNVHPALYWGKQSYNGAPPVLELRGDENDEGEISGGVTSILGHEFNTTGFLGASRDPAGELSERGFPSWLTIPDWQWLSMARRWHFFIAWLLVVNGIAFVTYSILSRHLQRDLIPTRQDWRLIGRTIIDHLLFRHPTGEAAKHYNVLQKCAYLVVIFFLLPLIVLMGLGMSPALDALFPGWVDIFFGRQSIRTIHFIVAWALVLFVIIHVFEVIVTGFWNNLRSMITGYYRVESEADHE